MSESRHVMIGGVGHPYLRDVSVGPVLVPRLKEIDWPVEVEVEVHDLHFGPIHVVQWLEEKPGYFSRVVLLSAANRGREPGAVYAYRWDGALPDPEEIHQRVCEAVTGIIGIDNLLIIGSYFKVWPAEVVVVEVEPCEEEFGAELSAPVSAAATRIVDLVRDLTLGPLDGLSADPLGPPRIEAAHPAIVSEARI
ncbi:MAG TPA: hydrogenase maturation protease [Chloroflexia bacterium]|nr:hydrogenase maturation protease [Chloroflexia bacterium]